MMKAAKSFKIRLLALAMGAMTMPHLWANSPLVLTKNGVECDLGTLGKFTLGIPALDGRGTHLHPISESVKTDGKTLTAKFGHPFEGVGMTMKLLDGNKVEYTYTALPKDLHVVMSGVNVPVDVLVPGLTVTFDSAPPITIPGQPGNDNTKANIAQANAQKFEIKWPTGEALTVTSPSVCWHAIQDARVWGFKYISVVQVTPVTRTPPGSETSTFMMTFVFAVPSATVAPAVPSKTSSP